MVAANSAMPAPVAALTARNPDARTFGTALLFLLMARVRLFSSGALAILLSSFSSMRRFTVLMVSTHASTIDFRAATFSRSSSELAARSALLTTTSTGSSPTVQ